MTAVTTVTVETIGTIENTVTSDSKRYGNSRDVIIESTVTVVSNVKLEIIVTETMVSCDY